MTGRGRAATYDRPFVAALYDLDVRLTSRHLWGTSVAEQVRFAAAALDSAGDGPVLEIPAGTGLILDRALAMSVHRGLAVAVDLSGAMLRRAHRRVGDRAACVQADVAHLPFRGGAFAATHSGNGFHLFPDRHAAATELARTLRTGGAAAITTWTDQGRRAARWYQRVLARLGHVNEPTSPAEHVRTFTSAGLRQHSSAIGGTLLRWTGIRT